MECSVIWWMDWTVFLGKKIEVLETVEGFGADVHRTNLSQ